MEAYRVPVQPFQNRYHELRRLGYSRSDIARWLGYVHDKKADPTRLLRRLGLVSNSAKVVNQTVNLETAEKLCRAFGLDPVDVGL